MEFFYRDFAQAPFTMRLPLHRLLRRIDGRIAMDFINLDGFSLLASGLNAPIGIDDEPAVRPIRVLADAPAADWLALRGDRRLMMETFAPSEELSLIERRLYYSARPPRGPEQPVAAVPEQSEFRPPDGNGFPEDRIVSIRC